MDASDSFSGSVCDVINTTAGKLVENIFFSFLFWI